MVRALIATCVLASAAATAHAGDQRPDLHHRVAAVYDFRPRDLNESELNAKSEDLDRFWNDVRARGSEGLEQLRSELRRDDAPRFFCYDGAKLLLSLSEASQDLELATAAIARADIRDVQLDDYFFTVHGLSVKGQDTTAAAFNILADPDFKVFVPQHALTLDQMSCLAYMLMLNDETVYVPAAIERLANETDLVAQKSLLHVLAYAVDKQADEAIRKFAADEAKPAPSRAIAEGIVRHLWPDGASANVDKVAALRRLRRKELRNVSDEAVYEVQRLTAEMRRHQPR